MGCKFCASELEDCQDETLTCDKCWGLKSRLDATETLVALEIVTAWMAERKTKIKRNMTLALTRRIGHN